MPNQTNKKHSWSVIGAGPAGITAIGKLLDAGIPETEILWVDPEFSGGDFATKWHNVGSNTSVGLFQRYLNSCHAFAYSNHNQNFALDTLDPQDNCLLKAMAEPLQWVTQNLSAKVRSVKGSVTHLHMGNHHWKLTVGDDVYVSQNVILAVGARAKVLDYTPAEIINLHDALNPEQLHHYCQPSDRVAVFGSSHSAILVLKNLLEFCVSNVINFYQSPLRFAIPEGDSYIFDNIGLKGPTANWAMQTLQGNLPENLQRYLSMQENLDRYLPECNKVVYAVGFESRSSIHVEGVSPLPCNPKLGIIAPGLFGLGIAFPELITDRFGYQENNVGLWKFMDYLNRILPIWLNYSAGKSPSK